MMSLVLLILGALLGLVEINRAQLIGNTYGNAIYDTGWTLQAQLRVKEADTFGANSPIGVYGRGFLGLISGYDDSTTDPGIYIHTTDDGTDYMGRNVWSQQAKLTPSDFSSGDEFGRFFVTDTNTILVSAPYSDSMETDAGAVFVFNGTLRHWTQVQKLVAADANPGDHFGELMSLSGDRVVISCRESYGDWFKDSYDTATVGAAYVFDRNSSEGVTWSRSAKLYANDMEVGNYFGENVGVSGDWVVTSAMNDFETGIRSGSAYMFKNTAGAWSQQQKLIDRKSVV